MLWVFEKDMYDQRRAERSGKLFRKFNIHTRWNGTHRWTHGQWLDLTRFLQFSHRFVQRIILRFVGWYGHDFVWKSLVDLFFFRKQSNGWLNTASGNKRMLRGLYKNIQRNVRLKSTYVAAIDQGTSSSRVILYDAETLAPRASHQIDLTSATSTPSPGWYVLSILVSYI